MRGLIMAALVAVGVGVTQEASAQKFDSTGWTLLGEETVEGRRDTDVIQVGRKEGRFTKLTVVVLDDDLQMLGMKVEFGNGETFSPELRQDFEEGSRSRAIDLPGDKRGIKSVTFTYGEFGRVKTRDHRAKGKPSREKFRKAKVQLWGLEAADTTAPAFDANGWTTLGKKDVTGKAGTATFKIKNGKAYDKMTIAVTDGNVKLTSVVATFARGKKATLKLDQEVGEAIRHVTFEVPASGRAIKSLQVKYSGRRAGRGNKRSTIEVFGQLTENAVDTSGWTFLGESTVDGKHDRDVIKVSADNPKFDKLVLVVLDDDIEIDRLTVKLGRSELTPDVKHVFKAGQRSHQIDLGKRNKKITSVELVYGNTRPRGRARVQIYATK